MSKKYYITTAIDYVNARPHIGHALEKIYADVIARYYRARYGEKNVRLLMGTDENSLKNVLAAKEAGVPVAEFVEKTAETFRGLKQSLNLSWDDFIRTTEERHVKGAIKFWSACKKEDIYKKKYKGLYCVGCEEFKTEKELVGGRCPEHPNAELQAVEEENYFFKLSNYQKKLEELIAKDKLKIFPESRKNEMLSFIRGGLMDFSISRSHERAEGWGIPVPGDPDQVMYVWFDALTNYITALGYSDDLADFKNYWENAEETLHVIGKGITRFHAIYWSAMLLSARVKLPKKIFVHGYVTIDGQKISKSLGNVVDPVEVAEKYGTDALRYFLLREFSPFEDGDFSVKKLEERYNGELANGLGNLVARVATLGEKLSPIFYVGAKSLADVLKNARADYDSVVENFRFNEALEMVSKLASESDGELTKKEPWKIKDESERREVMLGLCVKIAVITELLAPFLPDAAEKIKRQIAYDRPAKAFIIKKEGILFPRLP